MYRRGPALVLVLQISLQAPHTGDVNVQDAVVTMITNILCKLTHSRSRRSWSSVQIQQHMYGKP